MNKGKLALSALLRAIAAAAIVLVYFLPFYWMALTALKSQADTLATPPSFWVAQPHWENFAVAFGSMPFMSYLGNSLLVSLSIIL
jgi:sn-glycerol 3-phosphate transport system permease protein